MYSNISKRTHYVDIVGRNSRKELFVRNNKNAILNYLLSIIRKRDGPRAQCVNGCSEGFAELDDHLKRITDVIQRSATSLDVYKSNDNVDVSGKLDKIMKSHEKSNDLGKYLIYKGDFNHDYVYYLSDIHNSYQ